jgi:hypothetical protein
MSNPTMPGNGVPEGREQREQRAAAHPARSAARPARRRHTPGGAALGKDAGREAQRLAAAVLEVLAGVRTPGQAAEALGVTQPRYYQIETRAMQALVAACAPRPRGPGRSADKELSILRRQYERLQRELGRQRTLLRLAQRTLGLVPPPSAEKPPGGKDSGKDSGKDKGKDKGKKRRRRPVVRALRAAEVLQRHSQEARQDSGQQEAAKAAATPPDPQQS